MENFDARKIPAEQVDIIKLFIESSRDEHSEKYSVHLNPVLREDIFPLLDRICTVIYFPINDRQNNGFHVSYPFRSQDIDFVYINTAQEREKQIFTAAHELGHIWELDKHLASKCIVSMDADYCERIMNRFAAELLMPENIFLEYARNEISKLKRDNKITVGEMIEAITSMMNEFYVPYKAVVYRLFELELIREDTARLLWGETPDLPRTLLENYSRSVAETQKFVRLYKPDGRRIIDGLKELLDAAKTSECVPSQWLEAFYTRFELKHKKEASVLEDTLRMSESEENANAGTGCD